MNIMNTKTVSLLLRVSLAFGFLYVGLSSFSEPYNWIGYFPAFIREAIPHALLLNIFSVIEILLAAWLLWGRRADIAALVSAAVLALIVVFNLPLLDVLFRDIGLIFAALALFALSRSKLA